MESGARNVFGGHDRTAAPATLHPRSPICSSTKYLGSGGDRRALSGPGLGLESDPLDACYASETTLQTCLGPADESWKAMAHPPRRIHVAGSPAPRFFVHSGGESRARSARGATHHTHSCRRALIRSLILNPFPRPKARGRWSQRRSHVAGHWLVRVDARLLVDFLARPRPDLTDIRSSQTN